MAKEIKRIGYEIEPIITAKKGSFWWKFPIRPAIQYARAKYREKETLEEK